MFVSHPNGPGDDVLAYLQKVRIYFDDVLSRSRHFRSGSRKCGSLIPFDGAAFYGMLVMSENQWFLDLLEAKRQSFETGETLL